MIPLRRSAHQIVRLGETGLAGEAGEACIMRNPLSRTKPLNPLNLFTVIHLAWWVVTRRAGPAFVPAWSVSACLLSCFYPPLHFHPPPLFFPSTLPVPLDFHLHLSIPFLLSYSLQ